jgi:hypothetical protein
MSWEGPDPARDEDFCPMDFKWRGEASNPRAGQVLAPPSQGGDSTRGDRARSVAPRLAPQVLSVLVVLAIIAVCVTGWHV